MESELGLRLFERTPEGYFTTQAGEELQVSVERMEAESISVSRRLAGRDMQLSGAIRIALPAVLATYSLIDAFAAFKRKHPEITLEILSTYTMPDLTRRDADVAIRLSNDPPDDLVGRRVLKLAKAAYVSREWFAREPDLLSRQELGWIGWSLDPDTDQWRADSDFPDVPVNMVVTDPHTTVEAVKAGMGMSILPCFIGDVEPGLQRVPPGHLTMKTDIWVLTHKDLRKTARIRLFTKFIAERLLEQQDLFEGRKGTEIHSREI